MSTAPPPAEVPEPTLRPLTGGAVMAAASRITVAVTGALATILIARLLGPAGSGAYFVAQSLVLLLVVAASLGIQQGISYYVSSGAWAPRDACSAALSMALVTGLLGAAVALAARLLWPSAFGGLSVVETLVVVAALPFALMSYYVAAVALAIDRYEAYVTPPAAQSALALLLVTPGAVAFDIEGAVVGLTISNVVVAAGCVLWARRRLPARDSPSGARMLRSAISFGVKAYAAVALQMVNYRLDLFVLSAVATAATVGQYSVAFAVTLVLLLLPQALSEVLFPRVVQLSAQSGDSAATQREMVEVKSLRHVTLAVVAMTLVLALALLLLVEPIYGAAFQPAIELGLILLPGVALIGIAGVLSATIVGRGKPIYSLYTVLVTTPVTIALYATLIPSMDATGAALASTISYALTFVVSCFFYSRATGRSAVASLVPTRAEWDDVRVLPRAVLRWLRQVRA